MTADDLPAVAALEAASHAPLPPEGEALFAERLSLFPAGCLAAEHQGALAAYAVAHPWRGAPPALCRRLIRLPGQPDCLYLHDIAIAPFARGRGLVPAALEVLLGIARAHGLTRLKLTAVHGTDVVWHRYGFAPCKGAVEGYGEAAVAMWRAA